MSKHESQSHLAYIKAIMTKSEVDYREFKNFYCVLSVLSLLIGIIQLLVRNWILSERLPTGNILNDVYWTNILECCTRALFMLPILVLVLVYSKRLKRKNIGISYWLLETIKFTLIFCGSIFPLASTALSMTHEAADLFSIITASVCMLLTATMTDSRYLRRVSYAYLLIPLIVLSVMAGITNYREYIDMAAVSSEFAFYFGYVKSFAYVLYPSIGYAAISIYMYKSSKGNNISDL